MENRLKECQGDLFADRTPTPTMRANQLRLWLSSLAYVLMCTVRRIGLAGTKLARATCGTIRLALLKLGATPFFGRVRLRPSAPSRRRRGQRHQRRPGHHGYVQELVPHLTAKRFVLVGIRAL